MSHRTQVLNPRRPARAVYGTFTPCGRPSQWRSTTRGFCDYAALRTERPAEPSNPRTATVYAFSTARV